MASRRKSMLDAFRAVPPGKGVAARPGEASPRPAVQLRPANSPTAPVTLTPVSLSPSSQSPGAPVPVSPTAAASPARVMAAGPAPARPAPMRVASAERASEARIPRERIALLGLLAVVLVAAVLFFLKRGGGGEEVSAGSGADQASVPGVTTPPASTPGASAPSVPESRPAPAVGNTAQDVAFMDAKNRFTIRVAQVANNDAGLKELRAMYKHLVTEGAPVVQPIALPGGEHLALCVDAKAKVDELAVLRDWLRNLRGPAGGKKLPYSDAYIDNIDHVLRRF